MSFLSKRLLTKSTPSAISPGNWTTATLPSSQNWTSVTYGRGRFVAIDNGPSTKAAYSDDGITWTAATLPSSTNWASITYGEGRFVAITEGSNKAAYMTPIKN
jgi:hypothetical protein